MNRISVLNLFIGITMMGIVIIMEIGDTKGFIICYIGFLIFISGVLLNKKTREILINFILNFF